MSSWCSVFVFMGFFFPQKQIIQLTHFSINLSHSEKAGDCHCCCEMSFRTWIHRNLVLNTCYFDLKANYEGVEPKTEMNKKKSHWFLQSWLPETAYKSWAYFSLRPQKPMAFQVGLSLFALWLGCQDGIS